MTKDAAAKAEIESCLCPECKAEVDPDSTRCPKCNAMFPSMSDRQRLNTPVIYNLFRWLVLAVAIVFAIVAMGALLIGYFTDRL